jgi:hypothetical protein
MLRIAYALHVCTPCLACLLRMALLHIATCAYAWPLFVQCNISNISYFTKYFISYKCGSGAYSSTLYSKLDTPDRYSSTCKHLCHALWLRTGCKLLTLLHCAFLARTLLVYSVQGRPGAARSATIQQ